MGQKVHPFILRVGFIKNWQSLWFAHKKDFPRFIEEDHRIRKFINEKFSHASVARIIIERVSGKIKIKIQTSRPGLIIGRHGADIERLREDLNTLINKEVSIDIEEIKNPAIDAQLIAQNIAFQLEKRVAFRRAMKRAIETALSSGAKGIKISCAGRLGGAEMCRRETYKRGKIPLQTFRADIDYGFIASLTTYGYIGVKVWVYKGDVLPKTNKTKEEVNDGLDAKESKVS